MHQNKNHIFSFLLLLVSMSWLASCEPCLDCNPDNAFPFVRLEILNKSSLDTLIAERDSLQALITEVDNLITNINTSETERDSLTQLKPLITNRVDFLRTVIQEVNSKLIKIDRLNGQERVFYDFENDVDSFRLFRLPLNSFSDTSGFVFEIENISANLVLRYERDLIVENNKIKTGAFNLRVVSHSFDSLSVIRDCNNRDTICNTKNYLIYVEI